jgi:hypothetical protein
VLLNLGAHKLKVNNSSKDFTALISTLLDKLTTLTTKLSTLSTVPNISTPTKDEINTVFLSDMTSLITDLGTLKTDFLGILS